MLLGVCVDGLRNTTKHVSRSPGRYLNSVPPKYDAGVITIGPRRSDLENMVNSLNTFALCQLINRNVVREMHMAACTRVL